MYTASVSEIKIEQVKRDKVSGIKTYVLFFFLVVLLFSQSLTKAFKPYPRPCISLTSAGPRDLFTKPTSFPASSLLLLYLRTAPQPCVSLSSPQQHSGPRADCEVLADRLAEAPLGHTSCAVPTAHSIVLLKRAGVSTCSAPSKTNHDPSDTAERAPVGTGATRALSRSYGMAEHATLPLALPTGAVSGVCSSRASRLSR